MDTARVDLEAQPEVVAESVALFDTQVRSLRRRSEAESEALQVIAERDEPPVLPDLDEARVFRRQAGDHLVGVDLCEAIAAKHAHHFAQHANLVAEIQPGDLTHD